MSGAERPPRLVPLLYFGTAYVSLALACVLAAIWPRAVAGFFYHSWMVAIVHLITLGWITFSLLGTLYIVGPVAPLTSRRTARGDYVAYGLAVTGLVGMVAHFWIEEFGGMVWSAATVTGAVLYVVTRVARGLRQQGSTDGQALHVAFACGNFVVAASMGILLGFDKVFHFLPGFVLANVFAQFSDLSKLASLNARFNWHYRPGSDIFIVYNQTWDGPSVNSLNRRDRQLMVKFTRLFQR